MTVLVPCVARGDLAAATAANAIARVSSAEGEGRHLGHETDQSRLLRAHDARCERHFRGDTVTYDLR